MRRRDDAFRVLLIVLGVICHPHTCHPEIRKPCTASSRLYRVRGLSKIECKKEYSSTPVAFGPLMPYSSLPVAAYACSRVTQAAETSASGRYPWCALLNLPWCEVWRLQWVRMTTFTCRTPCVRFASVSAGCGKTAGIMIRDRSLKHNQHRTHGLRCWCNRTRHRTSNNTPSHPCDKRHSRGHNRSITVMLCPSNHECNSNSTHTSRLARIRLGNYNRGRNHSPRHTRSRSWCRIHSRCVILMAWRSQCSSTFIQTDIRSRSRQCIDHRRCHQRRYQCRRNSAGCRAPPVASRAWTSSQ